MNRLVGRMFSVDEDTAVVLAGLLAVVVVLVAGAIGAAVARDDSGMHQFFAGQGGEGGSGVLRPASAAAAPPLTIHRDLYRIASQRSQQRFAQRRPPQARVARAFRGERPVAAAPLPPVWTAASGDKPAIVSIYEDRTLRRGDAVMTTQGIRVFAGSRTFPFRPEDFRNVAEIGHRTSSFSRALLELDKLPNPG